MLPAAAIALPAFLFSHHRGHGTTPLRARSAAFVGNRGEGESEQRHRFDDMEQRNWEQGYDAYDRGFGPLTRQTAPALLHSVGFPGDGGTCRLLDVATGPGVVLSAAIDAAQSTQNNENQQHCHLTGLDITQNFLTLASQRIEAQLQRHPSQRVDVDFVEGSAESLPFPDDTFDCVVCGFGILHLFRPGLFLRESYRVLRPGGRLGFSAWAPPARTEGFAIALSSIAAAGNPDVEGLPAGPQFFDFGDAERASATLRDVGFEDTASVELSEMTWHNVEDGAMLYDVLLHGTSRTREVLLGQTSVQQENILSSMVEKYNHVTDGGKRSLAMPALVTSGQKPC